MFSGRKDRKKGKRRGDRDSKQPAPEPSPPTPDPAQRAASDRSAEEARKAEEEAKRRAEEERKAAEEARKAAAAKKVASPSTKDVSRTTSTSGGSSGRRRKAASKPAKKEKGEAPEAAGGLDVVADAASDLRELEAVKGSGPSYAEMYKEYFPDSVYSAFHQLQSFARELNTQISYPEFVLLGVSGHGKTSVLEAMVGSTCGTIEGGTQRPVYFQFINNPSHDEPKVTIKRDPALKAFNRDQSVTLSSLSDELAKRMTGDSDQGVYVTYEHKKSLNLTIIDTPGLGVSADTDKLVVDLARPAHRSIICVQRASQVGQSHILNYLKDVDPDLARTTLVYTHFYEQIRPFTSSRPLNKFLSRSFEGVTTFFVSGLSAAVRSASSMMDVYQERVWQAYHRDMALLETLHFDKRHQESIGLFALRQHVITSAWRHFQSSVPAILRAFREGKNTTQKALDTVQAQMDGLNSSKLRSLANNYVVEFLQVVADLIAGTSEGSPAVNGQTLSEERNAHGDAVWRDAHNSPIEFSVEELQVPYHDSKLYGGQQFERLLAEFVAIAGRMEITEPSMDDVATAAGINKRNKGPNHAWAASDLAQHKARESFVPLIKQLATRAAFVMKRLTSISRRIMESRRKPVQWDAKSKHDTDNMEQYRFFLHYVQELFDSFVDAQARAVEAKCMDEFYSTRTIYWYVTEDESKDLMADKKSEEDSKRAVVDLSKKVFGELRNRILKNVLLKFYNFFLVPLQSDLWTVVQGYVSSLSDNQLEDKFETRATIENLRSDAKALGDELADYSAKEEVFLKVASEFSHPIL